MLLRTVSILVLAIGLFAETVLTPGESSVLAGISAESIKGHVVFLASDTLEGRDTPSKGLDVAAEYIAAHFQRLKLEPGGGNGGYFQVAPYEKVTQPMDGFEITLTSAGKQIPLPKERAGLMGVRAEQFEGMPLVRVDITDEEAVKALTKEQVSGKALFVDTAALFGGGAGGDRAARMRTAMANRRTVLALKPALLLTPGMGIRSSPALRESGDEAIVPTLQVTDTEFASALRSAGTDATLAGKFPAPVAEKVDLKNVIGVLRGSDPQLSSTYLLVTAHYDHVGMATTGDGDRIRNGANDNASGTSTVLELAEAMARAGVKPKRTIVFILYFGEEKGLYGSRYYGKHPVFPLGQTVANLNLEQLGRTDDPEGDRTKKLTASGFSYTTLGEVLQQQSAKVGVEAWNDEKNSDAYFSRSDNQALADAGIPAITLCVAWQFPDYHRAGDHWDKLNYDNMADTAKAIALTTLAVANDPKPVRWIDTNPKTAAYVEAAKKLIPAN